jgi:hypothetical protein
MDLDSVLKQMRTEYTPDAEDRRRVESALTATILAGSVTGAAHLATSSAGLKGTLAKGSLKLLPVWLKGALGVSATVVTVGGGFYGVSEYRSHQPATTIITSSATAGLANTKLSPPAEAAQLATPLVATPPDEPARNLPIDKPAMASTGAGPEVAPTRGVPRHSQSRITTPVADVPLTSLGELQLIGEASQALQEGRSDDAQKVLREHERRYTNSALGQERTGLALLARCAKNDASAKVEATKFLQQTPNSPLAGRLKRECTK